MFGCCLVLASPSAALGSSPKPSRSLPSHVRTDRGIVQSVSATGLVLKTLDGGAVAVRVDAKTRVSVNGKPASLPEVEPGFVAVVAYTVGKPGAKKVKKSLALTVRAFDTSAPA